MSPRNPIDQLLTHEVTNQPPPLENYNAYDWDPALKQALHREGAGWADARVKSMGAAVGSEHVIQLGRIANRYTPELHSYDRYGYRIDEVEYHPAYHELMSLGIQNEVHSIAWTTTRIGSHVAHAALIYLLSQAEAGVCCPMSMAYAAIPALRHQHEIAAEWEPRLLSTEYDPRSIPAFEKKGVTIGMAMTEKQGGSDVRANTTRAIPVSTGGPGTEYRLEGHKWFCSAPMSDLFLTLAVTKHGLSCFLVPRWLPDGTRNPFYIQRLKDKLGNRSNASSEIEYHNTWALMVGEEGRGVSTIIDMVQHTRLSAAAAGAGLMRAATAQAIHHAAHRSAFGKLLLQQPAMRNVLADLAIETEAATVLFMRVGRAYDQTTTDPSARLFQRIGTALAKYWINKRAPYHIYEALECQGGGGYVEDSIMPRLYREAPLNSIWEGSGNVICLDILRAMEQEPETVNAFLSELELTRGADRRFDTMVDSLKGLIEKGSGNEPNETEVRRITEKMALSLQAALLLQHASPVIADAFCASRLGGDWGYAFGTLPKGVAFDEIIERSRPRLT